MKRFQSVASVVAASLMVTACATQPMGPRNAGVMPGQNKPFEVFQQDQAVCQSYANQQVGGQAQSANNQAVGSAVVGTLLGAGLGAAIGGGRGAAIGAAGGAVAGTAYGANGSQNAQGGIQRQYDMAYQQCMYSRGNQVAGYQAPAPGYGPPPAYGPPPPPPPPGY
jgi:uncharacterized protein YcfJ